MKRFSSQPLIRSHADARASSRNFWAIAASARGFAPGLRQQRALDHSIQTEHREILHNRRTPRKARSYGEREDQCVSEHEHSTTSSPLRVTRVFPNAAVWVQPRRYAHTDRLSRFLLSTLQLPNYLSWSYVRTRYVCRPTLVRYVTKRNDAVF